MNDDDPAVVERDLRADERRAAAARPRSPSVQSARSRMLATGQHARAATISSDVRSSPATLCSGKPWRAVSIAFAWISGPGITGRPRSTWMVLQRRRRGADHDDLVAERARPAPCRSTRREYEYVLTVPGGPAKSIQCDAAARLRHRLALATAAAATPNVVRPSIEFGTRRISPSESTGTGLSPACAPSSCRCTPPKTFVVPLRVDLGRRPGRRCGRARPRDQRVVVGRRRSAR